MADKWLFNDELLSAEFVHDPYPTFSHLRENYPVHWNATASLWMITRYDDFVTITKNDEGFSSAVAKNGKPTEGIGSTAPPEDRNEVVRSFQGSSIAQQEGSPHQEMRRVINHHYTPTASEHHRSQIRIKVENLLDILGTKPVVEIKEEFATILEMQVSALAVGIPEQDIDDLKEIVSDLSALSGTSKDKVDKYRRGILKFGEYLKPLLDSKLNGPGNDLLATLAKAKHHNLYSEEEVLSNAAIALTAGRGTSVNLICNGLLAFARHPKQWESLASDPTEMAIKSAVEECLRYDSPQQSLDRIASRDIELRGQRIRSGEKVRCYIGSANRDHMKFENADNFEINRNPNQHVAFGWGIHHCLGSSVSQVEFQEIISALLSRNLKPSLISPTVEYEPTTNLRSLARLDMQLG